MFPAVIHDENINTPNFHPTARHEVGSVFIINTNQSVTDILKKIEELSSISRNRISQYLATRQGRRSSGLSFPFREKQKLVRGFRV